MNKTIIYMIILLMYFISGIDKIFHYKKVVKGLKNRVVKNIIGSNYLPNVIYFTAILVAIIIEIVAPILIILGSLYNNYYYLALISCYALVIFTVFATLIYHFPPKGTAYYPFISNTTSIGALLLVANCI